MTRYYVDLPPVDSSKPWIIINEFDSREEAIDFCTSTWGLTDCCYCMLWHDGEYWVVDTPNPNINSSNNQFFEIEGFYHRADALDHAIANYGANEAGFISLLSEV